MLCLFIFFFLCISSRDRDYTYVGCCCITGVHSDQYKLHIVEWMANKLSTHYTSKCLWSHLVEFRVWIYLTQLLNEAILETTKMLSVFKTLLDIIFFWNQFSRLRNFLYIWSVLKKNMMYVKIWVNIGKCAIRHSNKFDSGNLHSHVYISLIKQSCSQTNMFIDFSIIL